MVRLVLALPRRRLGDGARLERQRRLPLLLEARQLRLADLQRAGRRRRAAACMRACVSLQRRDLIGKQTAVGPCQSHNTHSLTIHIIPGLESSSGRPMHACMHRDAQSTTAGALTLPAAAAAGRTVGGGGGGRVEAGAERRDVGLRRVARRLHGGGRGGGVARRVGRLGARLRGRGGGNGGALPRDFDVGLQRRDGVRRRLEAPDLIALLQHGRVVRLALGPAPRVPSLVSEQIPSL